jgi:hypothetical protein
MLAVGAIPAAGGRLQYQEVFWYTIGELRGQPRLNLPVYLPLRARIQERFPAVASLSDMQLLLLLTYVTLPWPLDLANEGMYCIMSDYGYSAEILDMVAWQYAHCERMPDHPQAPPGVDEAQAARFKALVRPQYPDGVPGGMELNNACMTHEGPYRYVDGLPLSMDLTPQFSAFLDAKLEVVTQYHQAH